ncbi:hypothetical protein RRG08_050808 [Elysia crispata]|uniref:RWD domain-containing protein 3 n=1 Tax=Elysia crispata TaxID=231223 RepID=A0AAE0YGE5_9GAST|nr:hypothetical protein RRG08_050808 [Elysia crispata]
MSGNEEQVLEVAALKSIYCKEGEITDVQDKDTWKIWIHLQVTQPLREDDECTETCIICNGSLHFSLPCDYPQVSAPVVKVMCSSLDTNVIESITRGVSQRANELQGEMMLLDLACLAKELLEKELAHSMNTSRRDYVKERNHNSSRFEDNCKKTLQAQASNEKSYCRPNSANIVTALLHLDHMRSKSSYCKLIKKWAVELSLVGRLIFCQRLILILLQGDSKNVKEYIVRNRTTNVDVDSRGRSSPEKHEFFQEPLTLSLINEVHTFSTARILNQLCSGKCLCLPKSSIRWIWVGLTSSLSGITTKEVSTI